MGRIWGQTVKQYTSARPTGRVSTNYSSRSKTHSTSAIDRESTSEHMSTASGIEFLIPSIHLIIITLTSPAYGYANGLNGPSPLALSNTLLSRKHFAVALLFTATLIALGGSLGS